MNADLALVLLLLAAAIAMIVALAASAAFMTPVSSPVNTLVVGPGNYAFWDFVRVGVSVFLVPLLLPLY